MTLRPDHDRRPTGTRLDGHPVAVTIAEAARVLGLSTDAIRKRLHRGSLPGEKVGDTWRVFLTVDPPTGPRPDPTGQGPDIDRTRPDRDRTETAVPNELVMALRDEVVYLRGELAARSRELAMERERADVLMREALGRIEALGVGDASSPATPSATAPTLDPAPRPWWRRLLGAKA